MQVDISVVGGGAAGLVAAIAAARSGACVSVHERNDRVGKKILATGNGRCNLTNVDLDQKFFHCPEPGFVATVLGEVTLTDTLEFFAGLGVEVSEESGRCYPRSMQAASVLDVLRHESERLEIKLLTGSRVSAVRRERLGFSLHTAEGQVSLARNVIIATGGKAAPKFGSTGDGLGLAESLGHSIVTPIPALAGLKLDAEYLPGLAGVRLLATVSLPGIGMPRYGEVIFTPYGISGIPVLDLTAGAARVLAENSPAELSLTLMPGEPSAVNDYLTRRFAALGHKSALTALIGLLPKQLGPAVLKEAQVSSLHKPARDVSQQELQALARVLTDWRFPVRGISGWDQAQTTAGGVLTREIEPKNMSSRICPNLYFSGEVVDVHGDCGGYNLQWAWSSGLLAGRSAAVN